MRRQVALYKRVSAGAPELLNEISLSTCQLDLTSKLEVYHAAGVEEYLVYLVERNELLWHVWTERGFELVPTPADGIQRSRVFPGLWLDVPALLRDDIPAMWTVLQQGLQTPEHAAFVAELARRRAASGSS